jgi:hypothetical protein
MKLQSLKSFEKQTIFTIEKNFMRWKRCMKKSREIHDNRIDNHHVYCDWLTTCSSLPSHLLTNLHMRLINFCLDSSHEIDQFLSWFFTWNFNQCASIPHMRLIIYLDSSHEIDQFVLILHMKLINLCLNSSHEINQFVSIPHMRLIIFPNSSHKIDQSILNLHTRSINFCLDSSHEIDQSASILHMRSIDQSAFLPFSLFIVHLLNTHPFKKPINII